MRISDWSSDVCSSDLRYLHNKYVGQNRFSLEGGDSLIPAMDEIMRGCAARDVDEIVVGMAHRGRLNLLVNVLGKSPKELFAEFEGKYSVDALSRQLGSAHV